MTTLSDNDIWKAREFARRADDLSAAAAQLRISVANFLKTENVSNHGRVRVIAGRDSGIADFVLSTAHGDVAVKFGHVFRDDVIFGHFSLFRIDTDVLGEKSAVKIWSFLTNETCQATWSDTGNFEWYFGENAAYAGDGIGYFLLRVAAYTASSLPKIAGN
jgi:hypothetical protein